MRCAGGGDGKHGGRGDGVAREWRSAWMVGAILVTAMTVIGGAPVAHAAGVGPCSPLTASDLSQLQATRKGNATAYLSRSQGTSGSLLTMTGGGWPASTPVGFDIWADMSGQFLGGRPIFLMPVTTTASGILPPLTFRLPAGEDSPCATGMSLNGAPIDHVTILIVAHTMESDFRNVRVRVPMRFTFLASPSVTDHSATFHLFSNALAGASVPLASAGWAPGERVTISPIITSWPDLSPARARSLPISTPGGVSRAFAMTADASGAFTIPYHLPEVAPASTVSLWIHADDVRFGDIGFFAETVYSILPAIFPGLQVAERTQIAGGMLTMAGDHWLPNQQGTIEYCRGLTYDNNHTLYCNQDATQTMGAFKTDASGHFFSQVRLPTNAGLGPITVQARIGDPNLNADFDSRVFAQGQPLTIVPVITPLTYAQIHPRRVWLLAHLPFFGAVALLALLGLTLVLIRRQRGGTGAQPAA